MNLPAELICLGEVLIDFTQAGHSPAGQALFERNPGGAPANVAVQAARLGTTSQFVGKVGADAHGRFLKATLQQAGVDVSSLAADEGAFTTLAFVEVDRQTGERAFSFARKPGADTRLNCEDLPEEALRACRVLHVGSLSLTDEPARTATLHAIETARAGGALISCDPNYRASLWTSEGEAVRWMDALVGMADLVKVNEEEARLLCGTDCAERAAQHILARGASLAAVTLGAAGALLATRAATVRIPAAPCKARDTTGAGDSFWGSLLHWLADRPELRTAAEIQALSCDDLRAAGRFACAAAACCTEHAGAIPAMPDLAQVEAKLVE